jgi:diaminopimelate epimerase
MAVHRFTKMHGLGNDFVVLDGRRAALALSAEQVRSLADRRTGIGCDQLILLEASEAAGVWPGPFSRARSATAASTARRAVT